MRDAGKRSQRKSTKSAEDISVLGFVNVCPAAVRYQLDEIDFLASSGCEEYIRRNG